MKKIIFLVVFLSSCIIVPIHAQDVGEIVGTAALQAVTDRIDDIGQAVGQGIHVPDPAYPNFTIQAGMSRVHGEFIRGKACLGGVGGFVLYGGVGRDWIFNPGNSDYIGPDAKSLAWHAGLGYYFGGDNGEFNLLMDYSQTPLVSNGSLNFLLDGTWYFGVNGHLGAFGGLGFSLGNMKAKNPTANFIFEIGLAYRLY